MSSCWGEEKKRERKGEQGFEEELRRGECDGIFFANKHLFHTLVSVISAGGGRYLQLSKPKIFDQNKIRRNLRKIKEIRI